MNIDWKPKLRKAAASAVAVVTSVSMMVGGVFHQPADLPEQTQVIPPPIVLDEDDLDGDGKGKKPVQPVEPEPEPQPEIEVAEAEPALPEEEKKGLRRWWSALSFRQRLLLIPAAALLGWGIFALASAFLPGVLGRVVAWLATLAALAFGYVAAEKAVFPDIPLKKLMKTRNFAGLLAGLTVLGAADLALPLLWSGYSRWEMLFHGLGLVGVFCAAGLSFALRTKRETPPEPEPEPVEAPEEEAEEEKPLTREDILALADTVSRRRK